MPARDRRPSARVLRRAAALTAGVLAVAGTAGSAYAYYRTAAASASDAGTAGAMTIAAQALSAGDANNDTLYPGGSADAILRLRNPNAYPVQVTSIVATDVPAAGNNCSPTGVSFTAPTSFAAAQFTLAADASALLRLDGAVSMTTSSASACQGQTFSLPVTVTVQK